MVRASDYHILWTRSENDGDKYRSRVSATELNWLKRLEVLDEARTASAKGKNVSSAKDIDVT